MSSQCSTNGLPLCPRQLSQIDSTFTLRPPMVPWKDLSHGFPQRTIFDSLDDNGLTFGIYYQNMPATLFFKSLRKLKHIIKFHSYTLKFKLHAKLGKLPNYVVVEQRYFDLDLFPANDDHPSHDMARGQRLAVRIPTILVSPWIVKGTETLPDMTKPLRPWGPKEDASLSEFQVELIQLTSQLNGDYILKTYPNIGKSMTVGEANRYAEDAVARFLEAGKAALKAGANESNVVTMKPSLSSRVTGEDYSR
ncbi:Non-specific phospholipase [Quillaja saponaria]|uniref:Non-specific phospholipase n=1 Tax=Quillaja saponaria TaxID=32244 RepID=A0AAD7LU92_QUISA|nr:Non-specific phospholipase [Quillaja saponaria]